MCFIGTKKKINGPGVFQINLPRGSTDLYSLITRLAF